ncbi:MAG: methylmalonyl Co-A mutase-associated GTPase MeaB [Nitrospiria bacterium]
MQKHSSNKGSHLVDQILKGDLRAASRLLTLAERREPEARPHLKCLYPHTGQARLIGITGPAGTGKSTLVNHLITGFRHKKKKMGVLAVDPTSPLSGGAILGDRLRMQPHFLDRDVFIRSLSTQGRLGGLSPGLFDAIHILDAMGKDIILIETIGVGQDEIHIARLAETVLLVLTSGMGDIVQTMKSGLLEIGDVIAVNKADILDGAAFIQELEEMRPERPAIPVSAEKGTGIKTLVSQLERLMPKKRAVRDKRERFAREELKWLLYERFTASQSGIPFQDRLIRQIARREKNPYDALEKYDPSET